MREGWTLEGPRSAHMAECVEGKGPRAYLRKASHGDAFTNSWEGSQYRRPFGDQLQKQREVVVSMVSSEEKHSE